MEKPIFILLHVLVSLSLVEVDINGYSKDLTHILSSYAKCKINSYNSRISNVASIYFPVYFIISMFVAIHIIQFANIFLLFSSAD